MKYNTFDKIVRFSYYLPFGYVSPQALELSIADSGTASIVYDPDCSMEDRLRACSHEHRNRTDAIRTMSDYGYSEKVTLRYDSDPVAQITMYRLTQSGLFVLTGTVDESLEERRRQKAGQHPIRIRNGASYQWDSPDMHDLLVGLNLLSQFPKAISYGKLEDCIASRFLSILSSEMVKAPEVRITPSTRGDVRFSNWKHANVNALFRSNGFLTIIDRLPMDCSIRLQDIHNLDEKSVLDIEAFCNFAVHNWFRNHPNSYTFCNPEEDPSEERYHQWLETPVYYPLSVLPDFSSYGEGGEYKRRKIRNNSYHHTAIGVASGKEANYVVYHTKPTHSKWSPTLEADTKQKISRAMSREESHGNRHDGFALMICPTVHQFKALFTTAKKRMGKKTGKNRRVDSPYQAFCIVPINHSGSEQLRRLMLSAPFIVDMELKFELLGMDENFQEGYSTVFPLFYNTVPVLLAHTMNFQYLFQAWELYEQGEQFYVSCFPEQVKFIRSIMPGVKFI